MQNRPAWQNWLARRQGGLWRRRLDRRPVTTTSCGEMNAQNSSRVSATSCGTIQATASRLAAVARLAHFSDLGKESAPFPTGSESSIGSARRSPQPGSRRFRLPQGGEQRLRALAIFSTSRWKKQRSRRLTPGMTGGCTPSISALNAGNFGPSPPGGERCVQWCAVTRPGQPRVRRLIARSVSVKCPAESLSY
jgi:hypothetical protein